MPITFFGVATTPADNGSNALAGTSVTPPASMLIGDLVIAHVQQRGTGTWSISADGGQVWDSIGANNVTANVRAQTYWARFNGTWSGNPTFQNAGATCTSVQLFVFRPSVIASSWQFDLGADNNLAAATVNTITSTTTTTNSSLVFARWSTADDNTWGTLTGTGWSKTGLAAQYRNLAGQDQSSAYAYYISDAIQTVPAVSQTQLTLGADATFTRRITFSEIAPITSRPNFLSFFNQ